MEGNRSCFDCGWNRLGGNTLLGICGWFIKSTGRSKEIPKEIVDKGCAHFTSEKIDFNSIDKQVNITEEEI